MYAVIEFAPEQGDISIVNTIGYRQEKKFSGHLTKNEVNLSKIY